MNAEILRERILANIDKKTYQELKIYNKKLSYHKVILNGIFYRKIRRNIRKASKFHRNSQFNKVVYSIDFSKKSFLYKSLVFDLLYTELVLREKLGRDFVISVKHYPKTYDYRYGTVIKDEHVSMRFRWKINNERLKEVLKD